jgi:hypothetical protein
VPRKVQYLCTKRKVKYIYTFDRQSQWPRGLGRRSAAARLLRSWVWFPPGAWMFICCECCVLSNRDLCDGLILRPKKSCRLWCVTECDLETSLMRRPWTSVGCRAKNKQTLSIACCIALLHCIKCDVTKLAVSNVYYQTDIHVKVKLSLCLFKNHSIRYYGEMEVQLHSFLTSALDGGG